MSQPEHVRDPVAICKEAVQLRAQGLTIKQAAERLEVNPTTLTSWIRKGPPKQASRALAEREKKEQRLEEQRADGGMTEKHIANLSAGEAERYGLDKFHSIDPAKIRAKCGLDGLPAVARRIYPKVEYRCQQCCDEDGLDPTSAGSRVPQSYFKDEAAS